MIKLRHVSVFPLALKQNKQTNRLTFVKIRYTSLKEWTLRTWEKNIHFFLKVLQLLKVSRASNHGGNYIE